MFEPVINSIGDKIIAIVSDAVQKIIAHQKQQDRALSAEEASKILGIGYKELLEQKDILGLSYYRHGKAFKFSERKLYDWIKTQSENKTEFKL